MESDQQLPERMPDRKRALDTAAEYVLRQRNKSYGEPDEDFQRIAAVASAMGFRAVVDDIQSPAGMRELTGSDVARFMIALKLARLTWSPAHEDSWIDIAGYAACGMETANLQRGREDSALMAPALALSPGAIWSADVRYAAAKAVAGDPTELEELGFLLADSQFMKSIHGCRDCDEHHSFLGACGYRIRKRRTD